MRRVLGIQRVSTHEQASDEHFSLEHQYDVIQSYCKTNQWILVDSIRYVKSGGSNAKELREILRRVQQDRIDVVIVAELDRLTRDMISTLLFLEELSTVGCRFVSVKDDLDMTEPMGEMRMMLLAMFAHYFRQQLGRKVRGGQKERWKKGLAHGGSPYGYDRSPDGRWEPNSTEKLVVQDIFQWYQEGWGYRKIAKHLNDCQVPSKRGKAWETRSVNRVLTNPVCLGDLKYQQYEFVHQRENTVIHNRDPKVLRDTHPAIIDRATWNNVQQILATRNQLGPSSQMSRYLLSGLMRCGRCGSTMGIVNDKYVCQGYTKAARCTRETALPRTTVEIIVTMALETELRRLTDLTECDETTWSRWASVTPSYQTWYTTARHYQSRQEDAQVRCERARAAYMAGAFSLREYQDVRDELQTLKEQVGQYPDDALAECRRVVETGLAVVRPLMDGQTIAPDEMTTARQTIQRCIREITIATDKEVSVTLGAPPLPSNIILTIDATPNQSDPAAPSDTLTTTAPDSVVTT